MFAAAATSVSLSACSQGVEYSTYSRDIDCFVAYTRAVSFGPTRVAVRHQAYYIGRLEAGSPGWGQKLADSGLWDANRERISASARQCSQIADAELQHGIAEGAGWVTD